jgi:hypothetical protein
MPWSPGPCSGVGRRLPDGAVAYSYGISSSMTSYQPSSSTSSTCGAILSTWDCRPTRLRGPELVQRAVEQPERDHNVRVSDIASVVDVRPATQLLAGRAWVPCRPERIAGAGFEAAGRERADHLSSSRDCGRALHERIHRAGSTTSVLSRSKHPSEVRARAVATRHSAVGRRDQRRPLLSCRFERARVPSTVRRPMSCCASRS